MMFRHAAITALFALASPVFAQTGHYQKTSGLLNSGTWANYSEWYSVCTDDLPDGYRIVSWSYALQGDRSCGAWANCEVMQDTDTKKCVRFQMQGHNEGGGNPVSSPWFGNGNDGTRQSELVISYTVAP